MVRKELREHIFKMLFQIEFNEAGEMPETSEVLLRDAGRCGGEG